MSITDLKTIGILGGMSSVATGEYYNLINNEVRKIKGGLNIAEMVIVSVNFANIERFVRTKNWEDAGEYLIEKAKRIEAAGADCLFLATNTLHKVRDKIKEAISIPFIDIFETVSKEIIKDGKSKIGMLGTYAVMSDNFFANAYQEFGVEIINPEEDEKKEINRIIFEELTKNIFLPTSKDYLVQVIKNLAGKGAEGVILGCTEIKLLISQTDIAEITLFDSTTLHCDLAAKICTREIKLSDHVKAAAKIQKVNDYLN